MSRIAGYIMVMSVAALVLSGCARTRPSESDRTPYAVIQEKANAITAAGGLAAVGTGSSRTVHLALEKAKTRGRVELAHILENKIDSMRKDFLEEIGEGADSEYNALFTSARRSVDAQILRTVPRDLKYDTTGGMATAWALMVQDPKVIADAFAAQANTDRHQYTRFRASQAFEELDKEVKKFEEFQQLQ